MSVQSAYLQASFRGVSFLIRSESRKGGKKTVIHRYPNSDRQFVEEIGREGVSISIQGFVHGPNAPQEARNLETALNEPGLGDLVHPVFGRLKMKSLTWSESTSESNMGEITYDMEFAQSDESISLSPSLSTASAVGAAADNARTAGFNALALSLKIQKTRQALLNVQRVTSSVMGVVRNGFAGIAGIDVGALAILDKTFGSSLRSLYQVVLSGAELANTLKSLYDSARSVSRPSAQNKVWKSLSRYESSREPGPTNTVDRDAIEVNTQIINGHTRINALIGMYESIADSASTSGTTDAASTQITSIIDGGTTETEADLVFQTADQLEAARAELEETFNQIMGDSEGNPLVDDSDIRTTLLELRNITNALLDEVQENLFNIQDVQPGETSLALLSYQYYGSLDNLEILRQLNPDMSHDQINLTDIVKVLS